MTFVLTIGPLEIHLPVVQAALSGFSERPMRAVARRYGAGFVMAEVVLDEHVVLKGKVRARIFEIGQDDHPIGGQLLGSRPEQFAQAANDLVEAGYDTVDLNFGCPVRKVLGRCRGGFLLSDPAAALTIVSAVMDSVGGRRPVTLKMRRGFDDSADSERNFFSIIDGAFERGVSAVTVHGRTVKQRYVGPSLWNFLTRVKRHVGSQTILGSGDLFTSAAVRQMLDETGVDGASVARGAIGNPFIFRECEALLNGCALPPPSVAEQRDAIEFQFAETTKLYDEPHASHAFRKFGIAYSRLHPMRDEVRQAFIKATYPNAIRDVLGQWYGTEREWPMAEPVTTLTHLIAAGAEA